MTYYKITASLFNGTSALNNFVIVQDGTENEYAINPIGGGVFPAVGLIPLSPLLASLKAGCAYMPSAVFIGTATSFAVAVVDNDTPVAKLSQTLVVDPSGVNQHVSGLSLLETSQQLRIVTNQVGNATVRFELVPLDQGQVGLLESAGFAPVAGPGGLPIYIGPAGQAVQIQTNAADITLEALGVGADINLRSTNVTTLASIAANVIVAAATTLALSGAGNTSLTSSAGTLALSGAGNTSLASSAGTLALTGNGNTSLTSTTGTLALTSAGDMTATSAIRLLMTSVSNAALTSTGGTLLLSGELDTTLESATARVIINAEQGIGLLSTTGSISNELSSLTQSFSVVGSSHTLNDVLMILRSGIVESAIRVGTADPTVGPVPGVDGALYIRVNGATSNLYVRRGGVWTPCT